MFGGQIHGSAGAFLDSAIAIRVFGELFTEPGFLEVCRDHGWRPLMLNTDELPHDPTTPRPMVTDYLCRRWRNFSLTNNFFRLGEPGFDRDGLARSLQEKTVDLLASGHLDALQDALAPLSIDHAAIALDPSAQAPAGVTALPALFKPQDKNRVPKAGVWLQSILDYLIRFDACADRRNSPDPDILEKYSMSDAILRRTENIDAEKFPEEKRELEELNTEFLARHGDIRLMSDLHNHGEDHYGHNWLLIRHWMESEWHINRQKMYAADVCILSSDLLIRSVLDFDRHSLLTYSSDIKIDDSLRITQQKFAQLDWVILISLASDSRWRTAVQALRDAPSGAKRQLAAERIFTLLAQRIGALRIEKVGDMISLSLDYSANAAAALTLAEPLMGSYFGDIKGIFGADVGDFLHLAEIGGNSARLVKPLVPGFLRGVRQPLAEWIDHELRRCVAYRNYTFSDRRSSRSIGNT